jgi:dolichol-phosphate mannosyltransferase
METISVVIPVYNETENVSALCGTLDAYAEDKPYALSVVFVDDGSVDDTLERLVAYRFEHAKATVVKLSRNFGSHAAIRAGLSVATGEYSMLFSGDLQEPVDLIGRLYEKIHEYDVVYVEKGATKISAGEHMFSRIYAHLIKKYAVSDFPVGGVNNFMMTADVRERFVAHPEPNSSIFLQLMDMGFRHTFIVCDYLERAAGTTKWTLDKKIKTFIDSFIAFSFAPIRAVSTLGILLSLAGIIYAIFIIVVRVFHIFPLDTGFPTLISVVLIGFGLTNISLGIIAEYVWRTLDVSRNRPVFIIENTIDCGSPGKKA